MYFLRLCHLLALAALLLYVAQASWPHLNLLGLQSNIPRQLSGAGDSTQTSSSTSAASTENASSSATSATKTSSSSSASTTSTASDASSTLPASNTATSTKQADTPTSESQKSSTLTPTLTSLSDSGHSVDPSTTTGSSTTSNEVESKSSSSSQQLMVSTKVIVISTTNSDGSTMLVTTTSRTTSTPTPALNAEESTETSGMSTKTRNIVIGVVVGAGGAIALGVLGLVVCRVWGRKKNSKERDGLMDYNTTVTSTEKPEPGSSVGPSQRSPFQSTLENYHQPRHVNSSSNF